MMTEPYEDTLNGEPEGILVHWMDKPRHHLSTTALSSVIAGAFLIGAGVGIGIAVLAGRISQEETLRSRASRLFH